jgi:hypothetical protein
MVKGKGRYQQHADELIDLRSRRTTLEVRLSELGVAERLGSAAVDDVERITAGGLVPFLAARELGARDRSTP